MARLYRTRLFSVLMAGAMALPLTAGWAGAAAPTQADAGKYAGVVQLSWGGESPQGGKIQLVQLSDAEVKALGFAAQGAFSVNAQASPNFANPAFQRTWERTDKPVASGQVKRSWYWGPQPNSEGLQEDYAEGTGGKRLVQYFDKSRMEINNPNADPNNPFFVTNGLLTVELISGKVQTGNSTYVNRWPADIALASDPDDASAPTYLSFQGVSNTTLGDHPATANTGQPATLTIARDGTVGNDPTKASYPDVNIVYFDQNTKHNVPKAMWDFLNQSGPIYVSATGQTADARLSDPWFYATGLPISEPYWARVKIAGQPQDVLIQAFERRVVTYVPNGVPGFKVQMGNIGQHYYDWRYKDAGKPANAPTPVASPTSPTTPAVQPTTPPQPTAPPPPQGDSCAGIPASQNGTVTPSCGPPGATYSFSGRGFQPGESIGIYVTAPDQSVIGARFQAIADSNGAFGGISLSTTTRAPTGVWAFTGEGVSSHTRAIGYFKLVSTPTPTPGPAGACDTSGTVNGSASPTSGRVGDTITFIARGFTPGEQVSYWFTLPDGEVFGTPYPVPLPVNADGSIGPLPLDIDSDLASAGTGRWAITFSGERSHNTAIIYFCINP